MCIIVSTIVIHTCENSFLELALALAAPLWVERVERVGLIGNIHTSIQRGWV
jgi:hypothetical protein